MRMDKYLKVTHLIRRREQAKEYIGAGYAYVNGKLAKPSTDVDVGDVISLGEKDHFRMVIEVTLVRSSCPLREVSSMYRVLSDGD